MKKDEEGSVNPSIAMLEEVVDAFPSVCRPFEMLIPAGDITD